MTDRDTLLTTILALVMATPDLEYILTSGHLPDDLRWLRTLAIQGRIVTTNLDLQ